MLTDPDLLVMQGDASECDVLPNLRAKRQSTPCTYSALQKVATASLMTQVRKDVACLHENMGWKDGLSFIDNN